MFSIGLIDTEKTNNIPNATERYRFWIDTDRSMQIDIDCSMEE